MNLEKLHLRSREAKARGRLRRWELRQLNHAKGAWFRLRRLLAEAEEAYAIDGQEAERLLGEGFTAETAGSQLGKLIIFVPLSRLALIPERRRLPLHIDADLLAARAIVLVPWAGLQTR